MSKEWTLLQSLIQMFRIAPNNFRSIYFLIATQFLVSLNNNMFRLLVIFFVIHLKGVDQADTIISLTGIVYVIPYILFISAAGMLADRISKQKVLVCAKLLEFAVMSLGLWMIWIHSTTGIFLTLFLMSAQNSLFIPSRYGIVLETVDAASLSRVNGIITSGSLFACTLGTFLTPLLVDVTNKNFVFVSCSCIGVALLGIFMSLGIAPTAAQNSKKQINPLFLYEIYETLKIGREIPHILPAIFGTAYFFFMASFVQLNLIPYAIQSMGLTDVQGGYLFLPAAIGVMTGAVFCGFLSKNRVEPGISCIAGILLSLSFLGLAFSCTLFYCAILFLFLIGIFCGFFLVPLDSFIQAASPDSKRGRIAAAANFFVFVFTLLSAASLYLIGVILDLKASEGFAILGLITFAATLLLTGRIFGHLIALIFNRMVYSSKKIALNGPVPERSQILVIEDGSWKTVFALISIYPHIKILIPTKKAPYLYWIHFFSGTIRFIEPLKGNLLENDREKNSLVCLFLKPTDQKDLEQTGVPSLFVSFDPHNHILNLTSSQK